MFMQDLASPGHNLIRALRVGRRSWWLKALAEAACIALIAGASVAAVVWVSAWRSGHAGSLFEGDWLRSVFFAVGVAFTAGLGTFGLRSPSLLDVARRVDHLLGQDERFSTAYEVIVSGRPQNVVTRALLTDVEERAASLDVAPAGWARRGRGLPWVAAGATLLAVAIILLPVPARTAERTAVEEGATTSAMSYPDPETLAGVAELLDLVADQEGSPYLRALSASFTDLAQRVGAGTVSAPEAEEVAKELAGHLQAAAHQVGGAFAEAVEAAFLPMPDAAAQEAGHADGSPLSRSEQVAGPVTVPATVPEEGLGPDQGASSFRSFEALLDRFEAAPATVGVRGEQAMDPAFQADYFFDGELSARPSPFTPNAGGAPQAGIEADGAGVPAGAAQTSDDAPGDAAGQGTASLDAASPDYLDLDTAVGAEVSLPENLREDGRFVEMELVPLTEADAASTAVQGGQKVAFVRSEEAAFAFRGIGSEHAGVVSRYFTPGAAASGDR